MRNHLKFSLLAITILLTGCVTGTRSIELTRPDYEKSANTNSAGTIYINSIEDNRVFEAKPPNPSTPSVKGDLSTTSKEKLSTLIGRQRNGFGKAMGDIVLPEGSTVQNEMRELLKEGLEGRGYTVTNDPNAPIKLDVDIDKFWAWFTPGMWAVSFEANLQSELDFTTADGSKKVHVTGYGINKGQVASNANWMLTYNRAFADFLKNLDIALDGEGL